MGDPALPAAAAPLRWLPNALTIARLAALPALLVLLARADGRTSVTAAILFGAVGATDVLDGLLARRLGAVTAFGRVADPLADRLLVAVGLVGLLLLGRVHPAGPAVLLARDALSVAGFAVLARRGIVLGVDRAGKASSALAMLGTGGAILIDAAWVDGIFWAAVVLSVLTLGNYARTVPALAARPGGRT